MIRLRPHHFLCTLAFQGRGYSPVFGSNYQRICDTLNSDPQTPIRVTKAGDDVCSACPHQIKGDQCKAQDKIDKLDRAHQRILGIAPGDVVTWQDGVSRLKKNMTLDQFHGACAPCDWKKMGLCEGALVKLHQETNDEFICLL